MLKSVASTTLLALASAFPLIAADGEAAPAPVTAPAAALAPEPEIVDGKAITVTSEKETSFKVKDDPDAKSRELWYRANDGKAWGAWQRFGIPFDRATPIVWPAPEGHLQVYLRKILTSGLAMDKPGDATKAIREYIVDRTAPTVAITFPKSETKLRGEATYKITWDVQDAHLRDAPVTITWSRDGKAPWDTVAEKIPNSGAYDWVVPRVNTTAGVLHIEAADKAANVGSAEIAGILVDSIRPSGRVVGPAISAKTDLVLELDVKDEGPAKLEKAQIWVSPDDGESWGPGPWTADPRAVAWKAPADGKYRFAVVATDYAGNKSPEPKPKVNTPDQFVVTVDTTAPVIVLSSAIGIIPADQAGANAQRDFKPGVKVQVPFVVREANPAPNSVTVSLQTDPAKGWSEIAKNVAADQILRFDIPAIETKTARLKVTAIDAAGNIGEAIASETFTIQTKVVEDTLEP